MNLRMKRAASLASWVGAIVGMSTASLGSIVYVDATAGGVNDGTSWENAYVDLQDGLATAGSGDEIWVAAGSYTPSAVGDQEISFDLTSGVSLLGGFPPGGGTLEERDPVQHETVLDGNGAYHVVTAIDVDETAVLDGFTITDGGGAGLCSLSDLRHGAGIYMVSGSPIIKDCVIRGNDASVGYCDDDCDSLSGHGGGVYCSSGSPVFIGCRFDDNNAGDGSGGFCEVGVPNGGCPGGSGGGLYFLNSSPLLLSCEITSNTAGTGHSGGLGGGIMFVSSSGWLADCLISSNSSGDGKVGNACGKGGAGGTPGGGGGGIALSGSDFIFVNCVIDGNKSGKGGNGISSGEEVHNGVPGAGGGAGGGADCVSSTATFVNCSFHGNSTGKGGDGDDGAWEPNAGGTGGSGGNGAAIRVNSSSNVDLVNTLLTGNLTGNGGSGGSGLSGAPDGQAGPGGDGAAIFTGGTLTLINCTVAQNVTGNPGPDGLANSPGTGGGVRVNSGNATLANTILWSNIGIGESAQSDQVSGGVTVNYSCIQGWTGDLGGVGNIGSDPLFVDPDGPDDVAGTDDDNLRLPFGSPCIDAGDNEAVPADEVDLDDDGDTIEPIPYDLDGNLRFSDSEATPDTGNGIPPIVDMGAYEFPLDCNANGIPDADDIAGGTSEDCTGNGVPDECESDCNSNGVADSCDIGTGESGDCNADGVPDECQPDGDFDGVIDECDNCLDLPNPDQADCNENGSGDICDIEDGTSEDLNFDGIPDECQVFCEVDADCDDDLDCTFDFCNLFFLLCEHIDLGCPCEGDANGDGVVDPLDTGFVLAHFGCPVGTGDPNCDTADQNGDGLVDPLDAGFVMARFGDCE